MSKTRVGPGERGFTFVELMYATGFFTIGLTALVCFQIVGATGSGRSADIIVGSNLASSTVEVVRVTNFNTVLNTSQPFVATYDRFGNLIGSATFYTVNDGSSLPSGVYFTVTTTAVQPPGAPYYELVATTSWLNPSTGTFPHGVVMQARVPME